MQPMQSLNTYVANCFAGQQLLPLAINGFYCFIDFYFCLNRYTKL